MVTETKQGGDDVFNKKAFVRLIEDYNYTISQIAEKLGISTVTLYRKMNGESDFFRSEIQILIGIFGYENIKLIFFAEKVS